MRDKMTILSDKRCKTISKSEKGCTNLKKAWYFKLYSISNTLLGDSFSFGDICRRVAGIVLWLQGPFLHMRYFRL